jgi:peptidoglycan hydrolase-like protein with peptidoglycan-binding domain
MRRLIFSLLVSLMIMTVSGCNIVPKSVQYQRKEEKLIGSTDIINPRLQLVQVVLKSEGYETGNTDGKIGKETREAIKAFQDGQGLKSTGYIDKMTLMQIEDLRRAKEALRPNKLYTEKAKDADQALDKQKQGSKTFSPTARDIQTALKKAGFYSGSVDGKIGPKTRQAIKDFQKSKGLIPDGAVGPKTWNQLGKFL